MVRILFLLLASGNLVLFLMSCFAESLYPDVAYCEVLLDACLSLLGRIVCNCSKVQNQFKMQRTLRKHKGKVHLFKRMEKENKRKDVTEM